MEAAHKKIGTEITETQHQQALYAWWRVYAATRKLPVQAFIHAPNEGKRSYRVAAILKSEGMQPGVPDIFIAVPSANYHGLWIEMKRQHGKATAEQKAYIEILRGQGYAAEICFGWEQARQCITNYLGW